MYRVITSRNWVYGGVIFHHSRKTLIMKNTTKTGAKSTVTKNKSGQVAKPNNGNSDTRPSNCISESKMKELQKPVMELVEAILNQQSTYVLPRAFPTAVAPHRFEFMKAFNPAVSEAGTVRSAIIFRPDPNVFMTYADESDSVEYDFLINQDVDYKFSPSANSITLDADILQPEVIKASTAKSGFVAKHFSRSSQKLVDGLKYYSGAWTIPDADLTMNVFNPNSAAFDIRPIAGTISATGVAALVYTGDVVTVNSKANGALTLDSTDPNFDAWRVLAANARGIWLGVQFQNDVPISVSNGFQASIILTNFTRSADIIWRTLSLWDLLDTVSSVNAQAQFKSATRFSTTGMSILMQNTGQLLNRGGDLYCARLPGNFTLDGSIENIIGIISSQTHHKLRSAELALGANLPWTPEKVQDWLFQEHVEEDPYNGNPLNKPYLAIAMTFSGLEPGAVPSFNFVGGFSMEYLTVDASNTFFLSPGLEELYILLCTELSAREVFSENPTHLQTIKKVAKDVVTSPGFRRFVAGMISAGVKVAPMVLSMLA